MSQRSPYDILGVTKDADDSEIKKAFRQKAKRFHPDLNKDDPEGAKAKFQEATKANDILTDPKKRAAYDRGGYAALEDLENGGSGTRKPGKAPSFKEQFGEEFGQAGSKPNAAAPASLMRNRNARRKAAAGRKP